MSDYLSTLLGWLLFAIHASLVLGVTFRVIMKRRPVGVSLAWLALIYAIPIVGVATYILFGEIRLGRKRADRAKACIDLTPTGSMYWSRAFLASSLKSVNRLGLFMNW